MTSNCAEGTNGPADADRESPDDDQEPPDADQEPPDDADQEPPDADQEPPDADQEPPEDADEKPSDDADQMPLDDADQMPLDGVDQESLDDGTGISHRRAEQLEEALRNIRRRYVIYCAKQADGPLELSELVDRIETWERSFGGEDHAAGRRKSVRNALQQTHLPKLERAGLIEYDRESKRIEATPEADGVEVYPSSETFAWELGFGVLSVLVGLVASLHYLGVTDDMPLTAVHWTGAMAVAIVAMTVAYAYDRFRRRRQFRDSGPDVIIKKGPDSRGPVR